MGGTVSAMVPFVSRTAARWQRDAPDARHRTIDGTLVFCDVSGFTALSERLATLGREGAEELTSCLDRVFTALLENAASHGGDLLKFGGDALLLLFDGDEHPSRAAEAARAMQTDLADVGRIDTSAGPVRLEMSVGLESGPIELFRAGGTDHVELFVAGATASATCAIEAGASAGEVAIGPAATERLAADPAEPSSRPWVERSDPRRDLDDDALGQGIPTMMRAALASGTHDNEHRQVAVGFIHLRDFDAVLSAEGPAEAARRLDELMTTAQARLDQHGVAIISTDIYDDGPKLIVAAGAVKAWGDDDVRLLLALDEVVGIDAGLAVRAGAHRGAAYVGFLGPDERRVMTVMGDVVNTAARVMAHAVPPQLLATPDVVDRADGPFDAEPIEPFAAKGKTEPVRAASLTRRSEASEDRTRSGNGQAPDRPVVGRDLEIADVGRRLERIGRVWLWGGPGAGKTAVAGRVARHRRTVWVVPDRFSATTPGATMSDLIRATIELHPAVTVPDELAGLVTGQQSGEAPHGELASAQLTRAIEAYLAQIDATLWVIDNARWIDPQSADLLSRLRIDRTAVAALALDRDATDTPGWDGVALEPLDQAAMADLANEHLGRSLHPTKLRQVAARAAGNPGVLLRLGELVASGADLDALPDDIELLYAALLDRLDPATRRAVRELSVLGTVIPRRLAAEVLDAAIVDQALAAHEVIATTPSGDLRFREEVAREAAYSGLTFARRRSIHRDVADWLRRSAPWETAPVAAHASAAAHHELALCAGLLAAVDAKRMSAHLEAARLYRIAAQAMSAADDAREHVGAVASLWLRAGIAHRRAGAYDDARSDLERAIAATDQSGSVAVRAMIEMAVVASFSGDAEAANRWEAEAEGQLGWVSIDAATARHISAELRVRLLSHRAHDLLNAGRVADARPVVDELVDLARRVGDERLLGEAYSFAVSATDGSDDVDPEVVEDAFRRGRELLVRHGQHGKALLMELNHATWRWDRQEWIAAADGFERTIAAAADIDNAVVGATAQTNLAELRFQQGRTTEAHRHAAGASTTFAAIGFVWLPVAEALAEAARLWGAAGDGSAADVLRDRLDGIAELGPEMVDGYAHHLAASALSCRRADLATELVERMTADAAAAIRIRALVAADEGHPDAAELAERSVEAAIAEGDPYWIALARGSRASIIGSSADSGSESSDWRSELIGLGVEPGSIDSLASPMP